MRGTADLHLVMRNLEPQMTAPSAPGELESTLSLPLLS
jgi:hypothetical protein